VPSQPDCRAIVAALLYEIAAVMHAIAVRAAEHHPAEAGFRGRSPGPGRPAAGSMGGSSSAVPDARSASWPSSSPDRLPPFSVQAVSCVEPRVTPCGLLGDRGDPGVLAGVGAACSAWWPASCLPRLHEQCADGGRAVGAMFNLALNAWPRGLAVLGLAAAKLQRPYPYPPRLRPGRRFRLRVCFRIAGPAC